MSSGKTKTAPTKNDIIVIAQRCIESYDGKLVKRLDAQDDTLANQNKVLNEHTNQLTGIEGQIREIYGNGSGRKGILDHMQETQATQAGVLATLQSTVGQEKQAQELFRIEVRNALKIKDNTELIIAKTNRKWVNSLKYLGGPIAVAMWELIKSHYHIGEAK